MTKKKSLVFVLVMLVATAFAVMGLSSCQWDGPTRYKLTFKVGEEVVTAIKVEKDKAPSEAELPADPAAEDGYTFAGWYNREVLFDKTAPVTEDVTYVAKFNEIPCYNVTFKVGDDDVAEISVREGKVIADADVPADPESDFAFLGWFNGDVEFDASAPVTGNVTYVAKFAVVPKALVGEWYGEGEDDLRNPVAYKLVVSNDAVKLFVGTADGADGTAIAYNAEYNCIEFLVGENDYSFGLGELTSFSLRMSVALSQKLNEAVIADEFGLVGTFKTEADTVIEINSTFVFVDGVQGFVFKFDDRYGYTFYLDGAEASIVYDSEAKVWNYVSGEITEKIIVPEKAPVVIAEAMRGDWSGVQIGEYADTVLFLKVTESEVLVYNYGAWEKAGAVRSATDKEIVVKNANEDITLTLKNDGALGYKAVGRYSDVDMDLEKKAIAVFMYEYRVYYVAALKDGKVDQDTFELSDPVKEAYRFDGWFNEADGAEFDDLADLGGSVIFEGRETRIANVVTFKVDGADDVSVLVPIVDGVAKLTAELIPAAPSYADGRVHLGWYNGKVEAKADVEVKNGATFTSFAVAEADYNGYWICNDDGKEVMVGVDVEGKKLNFKSLHDLDYKYENGHITVEKIGRGYYKIDVAKTIDGVKVAYSYYDEYEDLVTDEYALTVPKLVSGVKAGTYRLTKTDVLVINEQGIVTFVENESRTSFGYISGTKSKLVIKYSTENSNVKKLDASVSVGNILLGNLKNDPKIYVFGSEAVADYYCGDDYAHLYAHTVGEDVVYVYTVGGKYSKATVTGDLGTVGSLITVDYKFYNGTTPATAASAVYMVKSATSLTAAGAEKGEYTNDTLGTLVLDGFGTATLTKDGAAETYTYGSVNGVGVLVLMGEDNLPAMGVTLGEGTFERVEAVGNYLKFAQSGSTYYTIIIDGFGGAVVIYKSTYSASETNGKYTFNTDGNLVISGINYSFNGTYTKYDDGKVFVNEAKSTPVVLILEGYTPASHIDEFAGYYVNGDDNVKIVIAAGKASVILNGEAVKNVKANWNGSTLTYNAKDADATINAYTDYVLTIEGGNLVIKHKHATGYDADGYPEYSADYTSVVYTAAKEPSAEKDAFAGAWKFGDLTFTFDGAGLVTVEGAYAGTYTYTISGDTAEFYNSAYYEKITCKMTSETTILVKDESGEWLANITFTKQAEEALDGLQGTYKYNDIVIVLDGKGNGTYNNGTEYKFTYSGTGDKKNVSNFAGYDDDKNTITVTATGITVHFSGSYGDDVFNATFKKA